MTCSGRCRLGLRESVQLPPPDLFLIFEGSGDSLLLSTRSFRICVVGGIHAGRARWEGRSESSLSALMPYILKCFSVSMVTQEKTAIRSTLASAIVYWTVCMCGCTLPPSSSYPGSDPVGNRKTSILLRGSGVPRPEGGYIIPLSGSTLGPPPNWMSLEDLQKEAPKLVI